MLSTSYLRIETSDVLNIITNALESQQVSSTVRQLKSGRKKSTVHCYQFTLDNMTFDTAGDKLTPRIVLFNSYNGEKSLQISVGLYRFVCSNGLIIGSTGYHAKVRHVKGQKAEQFLSMLHDRIVEAIAWIRSTLTEQMTALKTRELSVEQQKNIVLSLGLSKRTTNNVLTLVDNSAARRVEDQAPTLYNLWQIVNEQMAKTARSEQRLAERNVDLLSQIIKAAA